MFFKKKTTEKGCYEALSSREKKKLISSVMREVSKEQTNLMKKFDRKIALEK